jgi:hypothetical protein
MFADGFGNIPGCDSNGSGIGNQLLPVLWNYGQ